MNTFFCKWRKQCLQGNDLHENCDFKNSIDRYLKKHGDGGYTLTTYTSGKPLIDDVSDGEWYDIIILDVSINGENGIEIAKRLRKIGYYGNITFWTERKEYVFD